MEHLWVGLGLTGGLEVGVRERVQRLSRFRLGGLDHHGLLDDQREVNGRRMESEVDHPLGHIEGPYTGPLLERLRGRDELVHRASRRIGEWVRITHPGREIVRVQHRSLPGGLQPVRAVEEHVRVRAHEDGEVSVESMHAADGVCPLDVEPEGTVRTPLHGRRRQVGHEYLANRDRARPRPSPTVRRRERLVGVDVHDVEAHVPRPAAAQDRVEIGAVVVQEPADAVDHACDLGDLLLEQAERVGVRQHEPGDVLVNELLQGRDINQASGIRGDVDGLIPGQTNAGRIRSMCGVRDHDLRAGVAFARVMCAHD